MPAKTSNILKPVHACAILTMLTMVAFSPVYWLDFNIYDDHFYVTENPGVNQGVTASGIQFAATAIVQGNYHPVTVLSHQLDVTLFGLHPGGHHAVNLLFHIANVCLLYWLLSRMTGENWCSLLVAALFAVHPLRVESVAWVSERKDVLSTFFMFLAMNAYLAYIEKQRRASYAWMLIWYALALLSKPMPVTLPFVLLLLDYWPLRRAGDAGVQGLVRALPRLALEKAPLFILSAASCVITIIVQSKSGAVQSVVALPLLQRLQNVFVSYVAYLVKFFLPVGLVPNYAMTPQSLPLVMCCALLLCAGTVVALKFVRSRPYLFTGWFWYVGMLVPVIGFVQVGDQAMADRYTYTPMIGFALAIVWLARDTAAVKPRLHSAAIVSSCVVIAVLTVATIRQNLYWKDGTTLFARNVEVEPDNGFAHLSLAKAYMLERDIAASQIHYARAMELIPNNRDVAFGLGTTLSALGRVNEAIPLLERAAAEYEKPADAYTNLGHALLRNNNAGAAQDAFERALAINPNQEGAVLGMGIAEGMLGNNARAIELLSGAVQRNPRNPAARFNLGIAYLSANRPADAVPQFEETLRLSANYSGARELLEKARQMAR